MPAPIDNSLRNTIIVVAVVVVLAAIVIAIIVIYRKKHKIVVRYAPTDPATRPGRITRWTPRRSRRPTSKRVFLGSG